MRHYVTGFLFCGCDVLLDDNLDGPDHLIGRRSGVTGEIHGDEPRNLAMRRVWSHAVTEPADPDWYRFAMCNARDETETFYAAHVNARHRMPDPCLVWVDWRAAAALASRRPDRYGCDLAWLLPLAHHRDALIARGASYRAGPGL